MLRKQVFPCVDRAVAFLHHTVLNSKKRKLSNKKEYKYNINNKERVQTEQDRVFIFPLPENRMQEERGHSWICLGNRFLLVKFKPFVRCLTKQDDIRIELFVIS
jgi:hypothetical protein